MTGERHLRFLKAVAVQQLAYPFLEKSSILAMGLAVLHFRLTGLTEIAFIGFSQFSGFYSTYFTHTRRHADTQKEALPNFIELV